MTFYEWAMKYRWAIFTVEAGCAMIVAYFLSGYWAYIPIIVVLFDFIWLIMCGKRRNSLTKLN